MKRRMTKTKKKVALVPSVKPCSVMCFFMQSLEAIKKGKKPNSLLYTQKNSYKLGLVVGRYSYNEVF